MLDSEPGGVLSTFGMGKLLSQGQHLGEKRNNPEASASSDDGDQGDSRADEVVDDLLIECLAVVWRGAHQ